MNKLLKTLGLFLGVIGLSWAVERVEVKNEAGQVVSSLVQGEKWQVSWQLAQAGNISRLRAYWDENNNGQIEVGERSLFSLLCIDGEEMDSDGSKNGSYTLTPWREEEGRVKFLFSFPVGQFIFEVLDADNTRAQTTCQIQPLDAHFISGKVVNPPNRQGILVEAYYRPSPWEHYIFNALTDAEGNYRINIPATFQEKSFYVTISSLSGYLTPGRKYIRLLPQTAGKDFRYLTPATTIRGTVKDRNNQPLPTHQTDLTVRAFYNYTERENEERTRRAEIDQNGNYILHLPPKETIAVVEEGIRIRRKKIYLVLEVTPFPPSPYLPPAYLEVYPPGQNTFLQDDNVKNYVARTQNGSVQGQITDETGQPVAGVYFYLVNLVQVGNETEIRGYNVGVSNGNGSYLVYGQNLASEVWILVPQARLEGKIINPPYQQVIAPVINFRVESIDEQTPGFARLEGRIQDANNQPIRDIEIRLEGYSSRQVYETFLGKTDAEGRFSILALRSMPTQSYSLILEISPFDYWEMSPPQRNIPLPEGTTVLSAPIVLRRCTSLLWGKVKDKHTQEGIAEVRLTFWLDDQRYFLYTDAEGNYFIPVPPGQINVLAQKRNWRNLLTQVEVGNGEEKEFNIELDKLGIEAAKILPQENLSNYPNPFNPECYIPVKGKGEIKVRIYNLLGQLVREIKVSPLTEKAGHIYWDGRNKAGLPVPSGLYFYEVVEKGASAGVRKMLLLK
jgi:hypothetical protein